MDQIRHKEGGGAAPSLGFRKVGGGHAKGHLFALQTCHCSPPCGCTLARCIAAIFHVLRSIKPQLLSMCSTQLELADLQAAVTSSRTLFEVEVLEDALQLVIDRAAAIHEAEQKQMHRILAHRIWGREVPPQEPSPEEQTQAIYADTPLFTRAFMIDQLPACSHKVSKALTVQPIQ